MNIKLYSTNREKEIIELNEIVAIAKAIKPKLIISGISS